MTKFNHQEIIKFWEKRVDKYGLNYKAMAYGSRKTQYGKFKILSEVGNLNNKSILDVGCGFGDLYCYLRLKKLKVKYTGYDIVPKVIELAKKKQPRLNLKTVDILKTKGKNKFDYVLSTGFNCRKSHSCSNTLLEKAMIKRMFELCKIGAAISLQSCYSPVYSPKSPGYFSRPERLFKYCMNKITKRTVLRHDYMPHDFTLYLYKKGFTK